jgi:hypothetical protein
LLQCIGAVKSNQKGNSDVPYQKTVTAPLGREHDNDAVGLNADSDDDEVESGLGLEEVLWEVLSAIEKARLCL